MLTRCLNPRLGFFLFVILGACDGSLSSPGGSARDGALDTGIGSGNDASVDLGAIADAGNSGMDAALDSGTGDLGGVDLGTDSGSTTVDMTTVDMTMPVDLGTTPDSGVHDSGVFDSGVHIDAGPSVGCGTAHAAGRSTVELTVMGETRSFMISVTDAYDPVHPAPLLFGVHGCGDNSMGAWYSLNLVTDGSGVEAAFGGRAIYVYPQGGMGTGCSTGWPLSHLDADLAFMDAIRAYMAANYCVDASGVMVIGLSYGAEFANRYACRRPSEIIFSSPLAAGDAVPTPCAGSAPMWISWGTADFGISEGSYDNIRDTWLTNNGCSLTTSDPVPESPMCAHYRDCDTEPVIACRIEGGLHAQPSPNYGPALFAFYRRLIGEIAWP